MANVVEVIIRAKDEATAAVNKVSSSFAGLAQDSKRLAGAIGSLPALGANLASINQVAQSLGQTMSAAVTPTQQLFDAATALAAPLDRLNTIAQQTGVSAKALSQLGFAASQNNTSIEALNTGLRFLARNLYAARTGAEEQTKAFRALGFSVNEIKDGLGGTEAAFGKIADKLAEIQDPGTRVALALQIFGRSAAELVPLLSQGQAGIDEFKRRADELGISIDNASASLGDQFGDAVSTLQQQFAGLKAQVAGALLPALTGMIEGAQKATAAFSAFAKEHPVLVQSLVQVGTAVLVFGGTLAGLVASIALVNAALATFGVSVGALAAAGGPIALAIVALGALVAGIVYLQNKAREPITAKVVTNAEEAAAELGRLSKERERVQKELDAANAKLAKNPAPSPEKVTSGRANISGFTDAAGDVKKASDALAFLDEQIAKVSDQSKAFVTVGDDFDELLKRLGKSSDDGAKKLAELRAEFEKAAAAANLINPETAEILFKIDPTKATAAVKALQEAFAQIDAIPVGVTIEQKALADALDKQAANLRAQIKVEVDPQSRAKLEADLKALEEKAKNALTPLRPVSGREVLPNKIEGKALEPIAQLDSLPVVLSESDAVIAQILEHMESIGVEADGLIDTLTKGGESAFLIAAGLEQAGAVLKDRLDPAKNLFADMTQAALDLGGTIADGIGTAFKNLIVDGHKFIDVLGGFAQALGKAAQKFLADITAAIAKALVLKAIFGGIGGGFGLLGLSTGGSVRMAAGGSVAQNVGTSAQVPTIRLSYGGSVRDDDEPRRVRMNLGGSVSSVVNHIHLAAGGAIAPIVRLATGGSVNSYQNTHYGAQTAPVVRLAAGGAIAPVVKLAAGGGVSSSIHSENWFDSRSVVHAAGGVRLMPGPPQAHDRIPAMLSPGEVVLPTIGGRSPGDLLAGLQQLGKDLTTFMARSFVPQQAQPGFAGAGAGGPNVYNISTIDVDGFRSYVRRGGIAREQLLADDPARG